MAQRFAKKNQTGKTNPESDPGLNLLCVTLASLRLGGGCGLCSHRSCNCVKMRSAVSGVCCTSSGKGRHAVMAARRAK